MYLHTHTNKYTSEIYYLCVCKSQLIYILCIKFASRGTGDFCGSYSYMSNVNVFLNECCEMLCVYFEQGVGAGKSKIDPFYPFAYCSATLLSSTYSNG